MTTPERAMQIANSGTARNVEEIKRQLADEGYASGEAHLAGAGFRKQLRGLIAEARAR